MGRERSVDLGRVEGGVKVLVLKINIRNTILRELTFKDYVILKYSKFKQHFL